MAKFLATSGTSYHLEELIKSASERLILISPYLKINERIKQLLEDKDRLKIDVRIVYGKNELQPQEINWLSELEFVRTSFCQNLHAKCYLNERQCIVTSLNLYEFSQVNNNEMGILVDRDSDSSVYKEAYEEAQRIIRISDEIRLSAEKIDPLKPTSQVSEARKDGDGKLSTSKLAKQHKMKTVDLIGKLVSLGYLRIENDKHVLTEQGSAAGGEHRKSSRFGPYFLWPKDTVISNDA
jgi:phosphatidylserine/phosphatidylglycerophosphate/cardiolipin synthase-like enzyme